MKELVPVNGQGAVLAVRGLERRESCGLVEHLVFMDGEYADAPTAKVMIISMRYARAIWCALSGGHLWTPSQSQPGNYACVKCGSRRSHERLKKNDGAKFYR
jgi:hypothetical protein